MSWDAYLIDNRGHTEGSWNYTHNTNKMANLALDPKTDTAMGVAQEILGIGGPKPDTTWWKQLDGMSGPDGARLLDRIITAMEADPSKYKALNPDNGWGDYDSFLEILRTMRSAVPEWPSKWSVHG